MNRRNFIKQGAIWVPAIVGLKSKAQVLTLADPARVLDGATALSCSVVTAWQQTTNNNYWAGSAGEYNSQKIKNTFSSSVELCQVRFWFKNQAGVDNTVYVKARTRESGSGSDIGSASTSVVVNSTYDNWITFTWSSGAPIISAGTDFWIGWVADGSHHIRIGYDTTPPVGQYYEDSTYSLWRGASALTDSDMVFEISVLQ